MFIQDILRDKSAEVFSVSCETTLEDAARLFRDKRIGFAIVRREEMGGKIVGTICERDIVHALARSGAAAAAVKVAAVMTTNIVTCDYVDTADTVMELMTERRTRHVLVYNGGRLMGVLSIGDMLKTRLEDMILTEESMRRYISGGMYNYR